MFYNAIHPLNNTDAMTLIRETMINVNEWILSNKAEELLKKIF